MSIIMQLLSPHNALTILCHSALIMQLLSPHNALNILCHSALIMQLLSPHNALTISVTVHSLACLLRTPPDGNLPKPRQ
jgi:hypothetical protein